MNSENHNPNRRKFIKQASLVTLAPAGLMSFACDEAPQTTSLNDLNIVGPKEGFTPQLGTLVSMMNWMRYVILRPVDGMSVKDLDYLIDDNANSIGAMLWHLAATERFYQINTFDGRQWGDWDQKDRDAWSVASGLGQRARDTIKGHPLEFYLEKLETVREHTLQEFAKRDDEWLMAVDQQWGWGPTNNYCKWFHVCEHESNHNGQFKFIRSRIPS
ncbi:MAG: DUF664 domain-containing protein [Bacteroidota bacterium]